MPTTFEYAFEIVTGPTSEPVTVAEAKTAARIDHNDEDALVGYYIVESREAVETYASVCLMPQTLRLNMECLPSDGFEIRKYPLSSVTSITYVDTEGTTQTLSASDYIVDTTSWPPRVVPAYGVAWPTVRTQPRSVKVTFVAGYASAAAVPETAKQAIRLGVAARIRDREGGDDEAYRKAFDRTVNRLRKFDMV